MAFDPYAEGATSSDTGKTTSSQSEFDPVALGATLSDVGQSANSDNTASGQLELKAFGQQAPNVSPSPIEEFSNPTQYPGFQNLPKKEQLQRIMLSGIDPLNMTGTGTFVPPGTYQNPLLQTGSGLLTNLVQPEIGLGKSLIGKTLSPFVNALARIGTGTASNIVSQAPNIHNLQDLKNIGLQDIQMNSILEGATSPLRMANSLSELYHPQQYAIDKSNDIRNEFVAAKQLQKQTYQPVFDKYGKYLVTVDPENYLGYTSDQLKYFTPEMKKAYTGFLNEPSFQNLHNFQSQTGSDYAKIATNNNKINTAQTLSAVRDVATNRAQGFLSQDPQALAQYNQGTAITRDLVAPYTATKPLKQLAYGVKNYVQPQDIYNAVKQGSQKIMATSGSNAFTAIPPTHPLINHMNDLGNRINIGKAAQDIIPEFMAKFVPNVPGFIQNKAVHNLFSRLSPLYYGVGRTMIGQEANQNTQ